MPNKEDIMKRLNALNKKIKDIMEQLMSQTGVNEEDAMFTKKPYGPSTCASCEKNLINIQGYPVDHHVWNKLPARENHRIARYGQGFSKLLNNL